MVPKEHVNKHKDQNTCLEGFSKEGILDDLEGNPLEETPHDLGTKGENQEEISGDLFTEVQDQQAQGDQAAVVS